MTHRAYLDSLEYHGIKLGLNNITRLLDEAGNPHRSLTALHVGGTNGKGSVVAMLSAILRAAGHTTGRFISPHLMEVNERFLFNAQSITDEELDEQIGFFRAIAERMENPPTYFEFVTAIAFRWFAQRRPDFALIEVGMGGRFDSTNVIMPVAGAITNIDLEHTRYLGDTLEMIAFEKAGIIKRSVPFAVGENKTSPQRVILDQAAKLRCPVRLLDRDFSFQLSGPTMEPQFAYQGARLRFEPTPLGLPGSYQGPNAAVAVAVAEILMESRPRINEDAVKAGLKSARWPCRLEQVLDNPPVIVDVAHNPAGAAKLAWEIPPSVIVLAVSSDKETEEILRALAPVAKTLILSQASTHRALPLDDLCKAAGARPYQRAGTLAEAVELGLRLATSSTPLVITGSLFTAGEARRILIAEHGARPLRF
jgi:dihydrofolate synthase / folylpolyglutamate synthase